MCRRTNYILNNYEQLYLNYSNLQITNTVSNFMHTLHDLKIHFLMKKLLKKLYLLKTMKSHNVSS